MTKPTVSGEIEKILEPLRRYSISIAFEQELREALSKLEELINSQLLKESKRSK